MKTLITAAAGALLFAAPAAADQAREANVFYNHHESAGDAYEKDIVETAAAAGSFETLLAAAKAAGLVEALKGDGPLTVFAPTDEAFEALPDGTVENLLKPENKDQLAGILKYHVIAGAAVTSDQLAGQTTTADTLNGEVTINGAEGVKVNDATVITADIEASNGVIHVIDTVLLPAS